MSFLVNAIYDKVSVRNPIDSLSILVIATATGYTQPNSAHLIIV